jgi:hypothetical protein
MMHDLILVWHRTRRWLPASCCLHFGIHIKLRRFSNIKIYVAPKKNINSMKQIILKFIENYVSRKFDTGLTFSKFKTCVVFWLHLITLC